ncbi:hypothetical protein Tco_0754826 [Tanacetum coccineum]
MDDPNMTMDEYIKLEEEKSRRRGRVFNWRTATYGKIKDALPCKSQVSTPVNDDIDFRISFDEFDDKDYTIIYMAPLPPREQRYPFLRYQGLEYTDADIANFEERMRMELRDDAGVVVFTSRAWGRLFDTRGPLVRELILEFLSTLRFGEVLLDLDAPGPPIYYTLIRDPVLRLCHRMMAHSIAERSQAPEKVTMTDLFYLRGLDVGSILGGLTIISHELLIIDMGELVRLQIYMEVDDTWAWVAMGLESQPDVMAGVPAVAEDAPAADKGRLEEEVQGPHRDVGSLHRLVERSMTDQGIFSTWTMSCMTQLMDASRLTYEAFDGTFRGSSPAAFQRRTRQRTGKANTSAA